ncbi:hypothetical protein L9F63_009154, partial [Diploptera punctata]
RQERKNESLSIPAFRIIDGEESFPGRWPWMAAIFLNIRGIEQFICGGSLIGPRHILTAAHFITDVLHRRMNTVSIRLGDFDLEEEDEPSLPETIRVVEVRQHPHYNNAYFYHDLAIMILGRTPRRSHYVMPLCLPPPSVRFETFAHMKAIVAGWGQTSIDGERSAVLRDKKKRKNAYRGDSGGPLML